MRRVARITILFVVISLAVSTGGYFLFGPQIKTYVQQRFLKYAVEGVVKDISTSAALELVEVYVNGNPTFTNYEGKFYYEDLTEFPMVRLRQEDLFEEYKFAFACEEDGYSDFFTRKVVCEAALVPTLETTISRVASALTSYQRTLGRSSDVTESLHRDIERRYEYLWTIMHPDSQKVWGTSVGFARSMADREVIFWESGRNFSSVSQYSEPVSLEKWLDPITGKTYSDVIEVVFKTQNFWGYTRYSKEHFEKAGGFWRCFNTYDREGIVEFLDKHAELLRIWQATRSK